MEWQLFYSEDVINGTPEQNLKGLSDCLDTGLFHTVQLMFNPFVPRLSNYFMELINCVRDHRLQFYLCGALWPGNCTVNNPADQQHYINFCNKMLEHEKNLPFDDLSLAGLTIDAEPYNGATHKEIYGPHSADKLVEIIKAATILKNVDFKWLMPTAFDTTSTIIYNAYTNLFKTISEQTYHFPTFIPKIEHHGRGYFVWPQHQNKYWTLDLLQIHKPWRVKPNIEAVMIYIGGHPYIAAEYLKTNITPNLINILHDKVRG